MIINKILRGDFKIAKTQETMDIENALAMQTKKLRIFGAFEVTIGWYGKERVDYLTYDYKDTWRCYEIKVSKADFYSKAAKTFIGHLNYFVMPLELYKQVGDSIPPHIGVKYVDMYGHIQCAKQAKRQEVTMKTIDILNKSLIRCLCRDRDKLMKA